MYQINATNSHHMDLIRPIIFLNYVLSSSEPIMLRISLFKQSLDKLKKNNLYLGPVVETISIFPNQIVIECPDSWTSTSVPISTVIYDYLLFMYVPFHKVWYSLSCI